jgi:hypothetical protein
MNHKIKIPKIFHLEETDKIHDKCILCEDNLLKYEYGYLVEKAFKRNKETGNFETVFEYAICTECQKKIAEEISQESLLNIQRYLMNHISKNYHSASFISDYKNRLKTCMVTAENISEMNEYQIGGQFLKELMIVNESFPFTIGEKSIYEIQELLSEKTKGFMNKFKDLILPPHVKNNIPDNRFIFF